MSRQPLLLVIGGATELSVQTPAWCRPVESGPGSWMATGTVTRATLTSWPVAAGSIVAFTV